jgi:hypothetical protein
MMNGAWEVLSVVVTNATVCCSLGGNFCFWRTGGIERISYCKFCKICACLLRNCVSVMIDSCPKSANFISYGQIAHP